MTSRMGVQPDHDAVVIARRARLHELGGAVVAGGLAVFALGAWALDRPGWVAPPPVHHAMTPVTAVALLLLGAAIAWRRPMVSLVASGLALALGVWVLGAHGGNWGFPLGRVLFYRDVAAGHGERGTLPSVLTAVAVALLAAALIASRYSHHRPARVVAAVLGTGAGLLAGTLVLGQATALESVYRGAHHLPQRGVSTLTAAGLAAVASVVQIRVLPRSFRELAYGSDRFAVALRLVAVAAVAVPVGTLLLIAGPADALVANASERAGFLVITSALTVTAVAAVLVSRLRVETHRSDAVLRAGEERFRQFAENATDLVYRFELLPSPHFAYVSPSATAITGYTPEEHYGDPDLGRKIVHPDDRPLLDRVAAGHISPEPLALRWQRKDGRVIWTEQRNVPVFDDDGHLIAINGIARDITARMEAEQALSRAIEQLQEADALKTAFVRTVAHDLRTPLAVIGGLAETLHLRGERVGPDQRQELLERISANAQRMSRIIDGLLDQARLERGEMAVDRAPTDIRALVDDVVSHIELAGHVVQIDAGPIVANVDATQVERIVENLLVNAVRHTPGGTRIEIRARAVEEGLLLSVDDAGPGVPDEFKATIFEPFRKGASESSGTGIGLSIVASFAALHGGRAWVEDRPGGGASFNVLLPSDTEVYVDQDVHEPAP